MRRIRVYQIVALCVFAGCLVVGIVRQEQFDIVSNALIICLSCIGIR